QPQRRLPASTPCSLPTPWDGRYSLTQNTSQAHERRPDPQGQETPVSSHVHPSADDALTGWAVQRRQAHVTIPEPGYRSSSESPGSAPNSPNSQQQKSVGFAPITAPGRVERRRGATPTSASTAWGADPGSCLAPANTTGSQPFSSRAVRMRPRATHPRRPPVRQGLARKLTSGPRAAPQPTSTAPSRQSSPDATAAPRRRPRPHSPAHRDTRRSYPDTADLHTPGATGQPSRRARRDGHPPGTPPADTSSSNNARRRATPTPADRTTRRADRIAVADGPERRSRHDPPNGLLPNSRPGCSRSAPVRREPQPSGEIRMPARAPHLHRD
ncbi:MAG: hypothetical protein QOF69_3759, partial [Solirubrobacteraceae bacterium]|nr:hypothetical protein [Solirubrobacteraceae bacterium]